MKLIIYLAALFATAGSALANAALEAAKPLTAPPSNPPTSDNSSGNTEKTNWSVVGEWRVTHPNWKGILSIRPDGTFSRPQGDGGKWTLTAQDDHLSLQLVWSSWGTETAHMIAPDYFRGEVRKGRFELRRGEKVVPEEPTATQQPPPPKEFNAPALKKQLSDSTWELRDGKHFTLHADGSTSGDWHDRKGFWRIVSPNAVQLTMQWRTIPPTTVTADSDATVLRWSDEDWGQIAKRVKSESEKP